VSISLVFGMISIIAAIKLISENNGSERETTQQNGISYAVQYEKNYSCCHGKSENLKKILPRVIIQPKNINTPFWRSMW
jgi:hypothetical protein